MRLTAHNVTHQFPGQETPVLKEMSLTARAGRMLALTGPSGSGKSTLLSIIGLILSPQQGSVSWGDLVLSSGRIAARARSELFGWVTQTSNVFGARTVLDNVAIALLGDGVHPRDARRLAAPALAKVGLADRHSVIACVLSGGETQRLTIARLMVAAKPIVLADEPTGQLDRANTDMVVRTLRAAADHGAAVVVATHDMRVADRCDDRLELADGRAIWRG